MITDRYLYKLEWGTNNSKNVFPIEDSVGIVYEKDDYMAYFRAKLDGKLIFQNDSKAGYYDYEIFKNAQWYEVFTLSIYRVSRQATPIWIGKFRIFDGEFDRDRCLFSVTPEPYDEYSCFLYYKDDEINLISTIGDRYTVKHYAPEVEYEVMMYQEARPPSFIPIKPSTIVTYSGVPYPQGYTLYSVKVEHRYSVTILSYELRRDVLVTNSNVTPSGWYSDPSNPQQNGDYKYVRNYMDAPSTLQNCYINNGAGFILDESLLALPSVLETERCIWLNDIFTSFTGFCESSYLLTFKSHFFQDATNYVIKSRGYQDSFIYNPLKYIFFLPKSEISNKSDAATRSVTSFGSFMEMMYDMFQVKWYIENHELHVEHVSYFTAQQGIDLTSVEYRDYIEATNKYSFEYDNIKSERWKFMEAVNLDFVGEQIEYTNLSPNLRLYRDADITEHGLESITTDHDLAFSRLTDISKDGWFVFQCYYGDFDNDNVDEYYVGNEIGYLSKMHGQNKHLSLANLHHYYWMHDRPFPYGVMNNTAVTFESSKKTKIQEEITVPACDIDVNKLVRTHLGWGEVKEAREDFKTRTIRLVLAYD